MSSAADPTSPPAPTARRELRAWRRAQLLDAAGRVLLERGRAGFTMEAIAAEAGVSKALPYRHFANSDDALIALFESEIGRLWARLEAAASGVAADEVIAVMINEYFDAVAERGPLLGLLASSSGEIPTLGRLGARRPPPLLIDLLATRFALPTPKAVTLASIVAGAVTAASDTVRRGEASRPEAQEIATLAVRGALRAVVEAAPA